MPQFVSMEMTKPLMDAPSYFQQMKQPQGFLQHAAKSLEAHENYSLQLIDIFNHQNVIELTGNSFLCGDQFTDGNMCHAALDHLCRAWLSTKTNLKIENYIFYDTIWDWAKELIESLLPANSIQYVAPLQPVKC